MSGDEPVVRTIPVLPEDSPFTPDPVLSPRLFSSGRDLELTYPTDDEDGPEAHIRVTFEGIDSYRVSRGEYSPYWSEEDNDYARVAVVRPSRWLVERHAYEAEHYDDEYEWGRGADTMLTDTHHYLFLFHDEFVEVLARGLWFERAAEPWPPTRSRR